MKKRKLLALLLLLFSVALFTTGCWNRKELDKLGIVSAIGIDKGEDGKVKLSVQIIKPESLKKGGGGGEKEKPVIILSSTGDTVFDAIRNFVAKSGRKLFHPHNSVIVLGEKMAREGVLPVIDWFNRDHEMRPLAWVMVTKGEASDIILAKSELENIPGQQIDMMLQDYGAVSKAVPVHLLEFYDKLTSESGHPVLGRIQVKEEIDKTSAFEFKGAGVFRKDKLIGWLDPLETRGYLWIWDKVKSGIITVPCPENENKLVSLEIIKAGSKIKPEFKEGKVSCRIEVKVQSNLGESMCNENLAKPETIAILEEEQRKAVEQEIKTLVKQAQEEFKVDILGLGAVTMRKYPGEWKELKDRWEEEFPQVEVEVEVSSKINLIGMVE